MVSWKRKPEAQRKGIGFSPVPPAEGECLVLIAGVRPIYWTLHQVVRATHRVTYPQPCDLQEHSTKSLVQHIFRVTYPQSGAYFCGSYRILLTFVNVASSATKPLLLQAKKPAFSAGLSVIQHLWIVFWHRPRSEPPWRYRSSTRPLAACTSRRETVEAPRASKGRPPVVNQFTFD